MKDSFTIKKGIEENEKEREIEGKGSEKEEKGSEKEICRPRGVCEEGKRGKERWIQVRTQKGSVDGGEEEEEGGMSRVRKGEREEIV